MWNAGGASISKMLSGFGAKVGTRVSQRLRPGRVDHAIANLAVTLRRKRRVKLPDANMEASAQANGLLLVTRNIKDFDADSPFVRVPYTL